MVAYDANQQVVEKLKWVIRDAEELLYPAASMAGDKIKESGLTAALESAKAIGGRLQDQTVHVVKAGERMFRDILAKPSVSPSAGGLLAGALVTRAELYVNTHFGSTATQPASRN